MDERERGQFKSVPTLLLDISERMAVNETLTAEILKALSRSEESRKEIHQKLDGLNGISDTVARLEPIVASLQSWHQQSLGAWKLGDVLAKVAYAIIGGTLVAVGWVVNYLTAGGRH